MNALLLSAYKQLDLASLPEPVAGQGELLIRVKACGICGSDVHGYDGSTGRRIPPIVMGHEAAGVVAGKGPGCVSFEIGDRVTFDSTVYCGRCAYCLHGQINLCDHREVVGVSCGEYRRMGAFADFIVIPERIAYRLPDALRFEEAAMLEAAAVALHAVRLSEPKPDKTALVLGAGMIGALTAQAARVLGFSTVIVADVDESRLAMVRSLGFEQTLQLSGRELTARILELTSGAGVDAVLEAVGKPETVITAIDSVKKGGRVMLVGNITPEVPLPLQKVVSRELRLQGCAASAGEYPLAIELIAAGRMQVAPLITAVAALEEGPAWFERLYRRESGLMKVVLTPDGAGELR